MKKTLKLFPIMVVLLWSTVNAQITFTKERAHWSFLFETLVIGDNYTKTETNSRMDYKKQGTNDFVHNQGNNPYISMAVTPIIFAISKDSSLSLLNLHSEITKVFFKNKDKHSDSIILNRGEFQKLSYERWKETKNSLCFQEIKSDYKGDKILVSNELFSSNNIKDIAFINDGFIPTWDYELRVSNIKLLKSDATEIIFEFDVTGLCPLDKKMAVGISGIYLGYDKGWASDGAKINLMKSNVNQSGKMTFSIINTDSVSNSDFIMTVSASSFNEALHIVKSKEGFQMAFYTKENSASNHLKDYFNWWVKNGVGTRWE